MNSQHIKLVSTDCRSKNRLRFASSRKRAKNATADVYRNYKRRLGVTSAATREEQVHHPDRRKKRARVKDDQPDLSDDEKGLDASTSSLAEELDLALDRNPSEIFQQFHREVWYLVRSLPEVLHHADKIVTLFNTYMLSPVEETPLEEQSPTHRRVAYDINHATTDILHLFAVLARDLRHEIHPFVHTKIVPRILHDLLHPPPPPSEKQPIPLDVSVVEAAFRTLSYIFRYDSEPLLTEASKNEEEPCLEAMRSYYGVTLAHRRDLIRRLAAETFSPLIRKIPTDAGRKRHLRRVLRALVSQPAAAATHYHSRLQADAVDGIGLLLFQVAKGVAGKLHSKGQAVIQCVLDCVRKMPHDLIQAAASAFLSRLLFHLEYPESRQVLSMVVVAAATQCSDDQAQRHLIRLVSQMVVFRDGVLLKESNCVDEIIELLASVMVAERFLSLSLEHQEVVVRLLCAAWKVVPEHPGFTTQIALQNLLVARCGERPHESSLFPLLMQELVPVLPMPVAMAGVGSLILKAAAELSHAYPTAAVAMVHALSCVRTAGDRVDDTDEIFHLDHAGHCKISNAEQEQLLQVCMQTTAASVRVNDKDLSREEFMEAAVATKAAALVSVVRNTDGLGTSSAKKVSAYILSLLTRLSKVATTEDDTAALCMTVDALARLALVISSSSQDDTNVACALMKARPVVAEMLKSNPKSLWTMKCSAVFVQSLQKVGLSFSDDDTDAVFDKLSPNLNGSNHFRRLHSLRVLCSFPKRPFVLDHANLDLSEDLDEEPLSNPSSGTSVRGPSGVCNIMDTLLAIESAPVSFSKERYITSLISRVEVLGRTGKLPVAYAESAASHMLGLLHIKFAPIWPAAVKALAALSRGHENCVWPPAQERLSNLMNSYPYRETEGPADAVVLASSSCDPCSHHQLCVNWEISNGTNTSIFFKDVESAREEGRVSRHRCTDEATVLESLWRVFEEAPQLLVGHSRTLVPMVLCFLHNQYYFMNPEDPDARELELSKHVPSDR